MLNRVTLIGRLTRDLDLKNSVNGKPFVGFSLAVNNTFNDQTSFISCFAWNKTAENMAKYLKKGSLIAVDGSLQSRTENTTGQALTTMQVIAQTVSFLDSRGFTQVVNPGISSPGNVDFDDITFVQPEPKTPQEPNNTDSISYNGDDSILWD